MIIFLLKCNILFLAKLFLSASVHTPIFLYPIYPIWPSSDILNIYYLTITRCIQSWQALDFSMTHRRYLVTQYCFTKVFLFLFFFFFLFDRKRYFWMWFVFLIKNLWSICIYDFFFFSFLSSFYDTFTLCNI